MKFTSPVYSAVSGSIAGITYFSNGGLIARARATPVNPNSAAQQAVRSALGAAAAEWSQLSGGNKTSWNNYAAATPLTDALGNEIYVSGFNMWKRWASIRWRIGQSISMPSLPASGLGNPPGLIDAEVTTPAVNVVIAGGAPVSGDVQLQISAVMGDGQASLKRPLRYDSTAAFAASDNTAVVTPIKTLSVGKNYVMRAVFAYDDGRVSQAATQVVTIAAA